MTRYRYELDADELRDMDEQEESAQRSQDAEFDALAAKHDAMIADAERDAFERETAEYEELNQDSTNPHYE